MRFKNLTNKQIERLQMKAILEFNLPEEREEFEDAQNGGTYKYQLDDIWNSVFRPRHKHGYSNEKINKLLENDKCTQLMDLLEEVYRETIHKE